jgi:hypothetical protein
LKTRSDSSIRHANPPGDTLQFGYSILDNAANNGTALRKVANELRSLGIIWNPDERYIRCVGHVINVSVKALLYGAHDEDDILLAAKDIDVHSSTTNSNSQSLREEKEKEQ